MKNIACIVIILGAAALLIDLGNRVFGSYTRSFVGTSARIFLLVAVLLLYLFPLAWKMILPGSTISQGLFYLSAALGIIAVVHFLFPLRWGIDRLIVMPRFGINWWVAGCKLLASWAFDSSGPRRLRPRHPTCLKQIGMKPLL